MPRFCVVNLDTGIVDNAIEYDDAPQGVPPGFKGNYIAVASDTAGPGWLWGGETFTDPTPPPDPLPVAPLDPLETLRVALDNNPALVNAILALAPQ